MMGFLTSGRGSCIPGACWGSLVEFSRAREEKELNVCVEREGRRFLDQEFLQFIVEYKHEGATSTSQHVGESSLEEGAGTFSLGDDGPAVEGALVDDLRLATSRLHHQTSSHGVEGIGHNTGHSCHNLGNTPRDEEASVLGIGQHSLGRVEETEVGGAVDDDTLHGHSESTVQTHNTVRLEDLGQTVTQTGELASAASLTDVSTQSGTGKVQGVDETEGGGSSGTARRQVSGKVGPELTLVNSAQEDLLVLVLEGEVEGLGGEVPDDVGHVTTPVGAEALLLGDAHETVDHAFVPLFFTDLFGNVLDLEEQFDTLNGGDGGFGHGGRHTAGDEILGESHGIG